MSLILGTVGVLLTAIELGYAGHAGQGNLTEEFHHTYPLSAKGSVALENINGDVQIAAWDRNEVKIDAIKRAWSKERLEEAEIKVEADNDRIAIRTEYPDHEHTFGSNNHDNPASVAYAVMVPRGASLDKIALINGSLELEGIAGEVRASSINGRVLARNLEGETKLETINSRLDAEFDHLSGRPIELHSVNGSVLLTLASDASAQLEASTVSGGIANDFGLVVNNHQFVGHDLRGQLGSGGPRIRLKNVNGRIEIRHALDNRPRSPVKDFHQDSGEDKEI